MIAQVEQASLLPVEKGERLGVARQADLLAGGLVLLVRSVGGAFFSGARETLADDFGAAFAGTSFALAAPFVLAGQI